MEYGKIAPSFRQYQRNPAPYRVFDGSRASPNPSINATNIKVKIAQNCQHSLGSCASFPTAIMSNASSSCADMYCPSARQSYRLADRRC